MRMLTGFGGSVQAGSSFVAQQNGRILRRGERRESRAREEEREERAN
jgi:hypothetical protein